MTPFEELVRPFLEVARRRSSAIERALWVALLVLVAAMLAVGIAQSLG